MVCSDCRYYNPTGDKQGKCERMSDEDFDMLVYADDYSTCPKFECKRISVNLEITKINNHQSRFDFEDIDDSWESISK